MSKADRKRDRPRRMPDGSVPLGSMGPAMELLDERMGPIVEALSRTARDAGSPTVRLERALDILFGAYAGSDPGFSALLAGIADRAGHPHVLQVSADGFEQNVYQLLAVNEPPAVIQLDRVMLQIYSDRPKLSTALNPKVPQPAC